jgi:hypothetical protein
MPPVKSIDTLVEDIYTVIRTKGGWDETVSEFMGRGLSDILKQRFEGDPEERTGSLRMSNMGTPCPRKLWYHLHRNSEGETLPAPVLLKFFYGDLIELLVLSLAKASGHDVAGMQDELQILGIKGHRDAVIDGVTVDVKSAAPFSFEKFKGGLKKDDDAFGYLSQLSSYVYAGHQADPERVHPHRGAFLVMQKVNGEVTLDQHWFDEELKGKEKEYRATIAMAAEDKPPARGFNPIRDPANAKAVTDNGNRVLPLNCSYCDFKHVCHPELRTFMYYGGKPKFFTTVAKLPKAEEVTPSFDNCPSCK